MRRRCDQSTHRPRSGGSKVSRLVRQFAGQLGDVAQCGSGRLRQPARRSSPCGPAARPGGAPAPRQRETGERRAALRTRAVAAAARCPGRSAPTAARTTSSAMPALAQLHRDRPAGQPALAMLRASAYACGERGIVDQAQLGEPVEHPGRPRRRARPRLRSAVASSVRLPRPTGQRRRQIDPGDRLGSPRSCPGSPGGSAGSVRRCDSADAGRAARPSGLTRFGRDRALRSRPGPAARRSARRRPRVRPMPSFSLIFFSISSARSGLSRRKLRTFSLP